MKTMKTRLLVWMVFCAELTSAQIRYTPLNAHSHNDYQQKVPFEWAYNAHFGSIEADIWAVDGELFVAHNRDQITAERTLDALYIQPIAAKFKSCGGTAWGDRPGTFHLLIDLKTPFEPTLNLLARKLAQYPAVFDPAVNPNAVRVVVSGNAPPPELYGNYPAFIRFDGRPNQKFTPEQLQRVAIVSDNLANHVAWRGKKPISDAELSKLKALVSSIHAMKKPVRFWNSPDKPEAWQVMKNLQVDFINTDHIQELAAFLTTQGTP